MRAVLVTPSTHSPFENFMNPEVIRRRQTLFVFFFIPGMVLAAWVTRTPSIRDGIEASISQMGMVLFGLSVGAMTGVLGASRAIDRWGTKATAQAGLWLTCVSLMIMSLGIILTSQIIVAAGFALFGLGMGTCEVAINVDGAEVERVLRLPVLHALHGCFSLGSLVGAGMGWGLNVLGVPVVVHLSLMSVLVAPLILYFGPGMPAGFAKKVTRVDVASSTPPAVRERIWTSPRVLLIGLIVFAMALAEGSANDWLPLLMVDEHGFSAAAGALLFMGFATAMTAGRFSGGWVLKRFGRAIVMRSCAILCASGIAAVVFGHGVIVATVAVMLWGLGASLGFPVAVSAAADGEGNSTRRVAAIAVMGYVAMLVGPPTLGFIGQVHGLRNAMIVVLSLVCVAALIAPAVGEASRFIRATRSAA